MKQIVITVRMRFGFYVIFFDDFLSPLFGIDIFTTMIFTLTAEFFRKKNEYNFFYKLLVETLEKQRFFRNKFSYILEFIRK